ncbi:MAG TPA: thioredoxin domain-containing protein [Candidatus Limnocylindrales bacterium]|nr:thioredoxin domain-containing protein [Candidatus Limnocylindrales bacterium]
MGDRQATPSTSPRANRLAGETSPYLLQHAHNPVDWYPWGDEALARARSEDRPIFLSIGYAACHWCHVMERESFEDEATAQVLNEGFVSIKVDREERPDLDSIYMDAVQQMTGHGGWPMSVFLTPEGRPFYGGTYFPDQPRHGMPSFRQVLEGVLSAWQDRRAEIEQAGASLAEALSRQAQLGAGERPSTWMLDSSLLALERSFDARNGGWGAAPKFPQPMTIEMLLGEHLRTGDRRPLAMALRSLDAMAAGGIYDHLAGGFARYATDAGWLVPHFEKMLYDNALLTRAYVHAWQLTRTERYREVAEDTLAFVEREMTTVEGGFIASLDADTQGEEGATYVWAKAEIDQLLGADAPLLHAAYGVTEEGNWEGRTILSRVRSGEQLASEHGLAAEEVEIRLADLRQRLLAARDRRPQPGRDEKVLAAWNGLMIAACADASVAFGDPRHAQLGERAASLLLDRLADPDGRLSRSWKDGRARGGGVLEDYANLADGLLALYQATFDERWFQAARQLAGHILARFADPAGGFFDTADDHEQLVSRPKGVQDNAVPAGGSMASHVLLRLAALTGEGRYRDAAEGAIAQVAPLAARYPTAFAHWLSAMQLALGRIDEVAIVGPPDRADTLALLSEVRRQYRPLTVIAAGMPESTAVPLLRDRPLKDGAATAYVCHGFSCRQPVTDSEGLAAQLSSAP